MAKLLRTALAMLLAWPVWAGAASYATVQGRPRVAGGKAARAAATVAIPEPGGDFLRHVLMSPNLPPETAQRLAAAVLSLQCDTEWRATVEKVGVK